MPFSLSFYMPDFILRMGMSVDDKEGAHTILREILNTFFLEAI